MNEEEKKAVEFVKERTKELKKYAERENELVYDDIILNLIEKLQKENEKLNEKILDNAGIYQLGFKDGEESYIKKLKDKIEKLNSVSYAEELEDIMNRGNYTITELVQYVLQELLEKENKIK